MTTPNIPVAVMRRLVKFSKHLNAGEAWTYTDRHGSFESMRLHDGSLRVRKPTGPVEVPLDGEHWGPPLWAKLHTLETKTAADRQAIVEEVTNAIPCGICKDHWLEILAELPPDLTTAENFWLWTVEAHNRVNDSLGKPRMLPEDLMLG